MEYTSQSALHFPAAYAPISEDEMIYLDGGDAISPQQFTFNLVTNLIRLMGQAAFSGALNGLSNMRNDGLTTGGAIAHYWNRQNTLGKVATVVFTGFAGYAVYIYCVSLVNNVLNLYTSAKQHHRRGPEHHRHHGGGFVRPHHSGHCGTDGGLMPTAPCV